MPEYEVTGYGHCGWHHMCELRLTVSASSQNMVRLLFNRRALRADPEHPGFVAETVGYHVVEQAGPGAALTALSGPVAAHALSQALTGAFLGAAHQEPPERHAVAVVALFDLVPETVWHEVMGSLVDALADSGLRLCTTAPGGTTSGATEDPVEGVRERSEAGDE